MSRPRRLRYSTLWNPALSRAEAARVLGIAETADEREAKRAFRALSFQYHPDYNKSPNADAEFNKIRDAYEVFEKSAAAPPRGAETISERMERMRREAEARIRRQAAAEKRPKLKPEFTPEVLVVPVNWAVTVPGSTAAADSTLLGVRRDGNVELHVKGIYQTASPSLPAMVYKLIKLVQIQPDYTRKGDWERYITFVATESPPRLEVYALHELADRVNLPRSGDDVLPPHAPRSRGGSMDPSEFS
jgi:hypothetical protein